MNARLSEFAEYVVRDVLGQMDGITVKRLFGGYGVYHRGAIFGIITASDEFYFKARSERAAREYERCGCKQFSYERNGKTIKLPYWSVPEEVLEERDEAMRWALRAAGESAV